MLLLSERITQRLCIFKIWYLHYEILKSPGIAILWATSDIELV